MRQKVALLFVLLAFISAGPKRAARVSFLKGEANLSRQGVSLPVSVGMPLYAKDKIVTQKGTRVEITFTDESIVRLSSFTVLVIRELPKKAEGGVRLKQKLGKIWNRVTKGTSGYRVETPTALAGVKGTVFGLNVASKEKTEVKVYQGEVEVKSWQEAVEEGKLPTGPPHEVEGPREVTQQEWMRIVGEQQQLTVERGKEPGKPEPFDLKKEAEDPWVAWNLKRDRALEKK